MKVLVLSDIHSRREMLEKIGGSIHNDFDTALLLGDLTNFGDTPAAKIVELLGTKKCYAIPGNLDSWETLREIEEAGISLHGKSIKLEKFTVVGLGGGLHGNPGRVLYSEERIGKELVRLLEGTENVILATHLPPKNTKLDTVHGGVHVGSSAVREAIERFQPLLQLCGHIHEAKGETKIGGTKCINVGAVKDGNALLLHLDEGLSFEGIRVGQ